MAARSLRKRICDVIAGAAGSCSRNSTPPVDIHSRLDEIFSSHVKGADGVAAAEEIGADDENITPLMVACDKCCSGALAYMRNQITTSHDQIDDNSQPSLRELLDAWGHPTEVSSCGNSAAAHALAAGFDEGFDLLVDLLEYESSEETQNARAFALLSQTNQNGDTPLMMACVSGHVSTLKHVFECCLKRALSSNCNNAGVPVKETWRSLQDILAIRNNEECTALNLACGYGHSDTVEFLLRPQHVRTPAGGGVAVKFLAGSDVDSCEVDTLVHKMDPLASVAYVDVDFCKKTVDNLAAGLKFMKQHNQMDRVKEFEDQHTLAKACLRIVKLELERISLEVADELLLGNYEAKQKEELVADSSCTSNGGTKTKGNMKKKKRRNHKKQNQHNEADKKDDKEQAAKPDGSATETTHKSWTSVKAGSDMEQTHGLSTRSSPFITLQDGTVVSKKSDHNSLVQDNAHFLESDVHHNVNPDSRVEPLQSILQSTSGSNSNDEVAAVMESLCIEPSMLLLSAHGMAMLMSPCQLDTIESILTHQLNATKEAKRIQSRLLDK